MSQGPFSPSSSFSIFISVLLLLVPVGDAIMMTLRSQHKCVLESYVEPKTLLGTWKWVAGVTTTTMVLFEIKDANGKMMFSSDLEAGSFSVFGTSFEFCFTKGSGISCRGWKQTANCNPHGFRESQLDQPCDAQINQGMSGFCECQKVQRQGTEVIHVINRKYFSCHHDAFTCDTICNSADSDMINSASISLHYSPVRRRLDYAKIPSSDKVESATRVVMDLADEVSELKQELEEHLADEAAFQESSDWLHKMVVWLHMLVVATGLVSGACQVAITLRIIRLARHSDVRKQAKDAITKSTPPSATATSTTKETVATTAATTTSTREATTTITESGSTLKTRIT